MRLASAGLAIAGLAVGVVAWAQVERASIVGTVTDKTGAVVAGVDVRVTHETTNIVVALRTDDSGNYSAPNLIPGSYTVTAGHAGFNRRVFRGFQVQVGQTARLDITLEVGAVEQTVEVSGTIPLLHTEDATIGQVVVPELIDALPQNGRNFAMLAMSAPGVAALDYVQPGTINSGRRPDELRPGGTALQANGARSYLNQVLIDGIDATEMISQTFVVRPSVDSIQEFKVITNNAGAEFGRAGGAVVVISTKSGGNAFHGTAYEFLRNSALDAKNFFDRPNDKIPPFRQNQFGASLGGRFIRDRAFFFMDYEGQREVLGQTQVNTVPTAQMKAGDFRGIAPNGIFDPLTTTTSPLGRTRFADDRLPQSRFDPIAARLVNLYPAPHTAGLANNYVANPTKRSAPHLAARLPQLEIRRGPAAPPDQRNRQPSGPERFRPLQLRQRVHQQPRLHRRHRPRHGHYAAGLPQSDRARLLHTGNGVRGVAGVQFLCPRRVAGQPPPHSKPRHPL